MNTHDPSLLSVKALILVLALVQIASNNVIAAECPTLVGTLAPRGPAGPVSSDGEIIALGTGPILRILNRSDLSTPVQFGEVVLPDDILTLAVADDHVYVGGSGGFLRVFDLTNPSAPNEVGSFWLQGDPEDIEIVDGIAYISHRKGLWTLDVSTPSDLTGLGHIAFHDTWYWSPSAVAVLDDYAYVTNDRRNVRVIDVSSPSTPAEVTLIEAGRFTADVAAAGQHVFVSDRNEGLFVFDVSVPSTPVQIGSLRPSGGTDEIAVSGNLVYALTDDYLHTIDVSSPSTPTTVSTYEWFRNAVELDVSGDVVYVSDSSQGLLAIDASKPSAPTATGVFNAPGFGVEVAVSGHFAYLAENGAGLRVVDVRIPESPIEVGFLDLPGYFNGGATAVAVSGDYAYVIGSGRQFIVVDVISPTSPTEVSSFWSVHQAYGIAVSNGHAYVARGSSGLEVIDVGNPAEPIVVGSLDAGFHAFDVFTTGNLVYVADYGGGLRIIDVSTPATPIEVGHIDTPGHSYEVFVSGSLAYLAGDETGLRVIDVSTPSDPLEIHSYRVPKYGRHVAVDHGFAYLTAPSLQGAAAIDTSGSDAFEGICLIDTPGYPYDFLPVGDLVYVADGSAGLSILRASKRKYWLDNAANLPGLFGSRWRTNVTARNVGPSEANVEFVLHTSEGAKTLSRAIAGGEQVAIEDIVGLMGYEGKGCLEITSDESLQISGQIFNQTSEGTFGQYLEAFESSQGLDPGESATLLQLRQMRGEYRTNLSITNTHDESATVAIRLFNSGGDELIEYTLDVGPKSLVQDPQPFRQRAGQPDLGWGFAEVEVLSGSGILASASVVDSQTNDATTIPFKR